MLIKVICVKLIENLITKTSILIYNKTKPRTGNLTIHQKNKQMAEYQKEFVMVKNFSETDRGTNRRKSVTNFMEMSSYYSAANQYHEFLKCFQSRLQKIYEKQCYRIYLNDKTNQRQYKELIKQKDDLMQALQDSKDYRQSVNRGLIEEIMNLQKLKEQYEARNQEYEKKICSHKKEILKKKKQLKELQTEIKSYWLYNYDITNTTLNISKNCTVMPRKDKKDNYYCHMGNLDSYKITVRGNGTNKQNNDTTNLKESVVSTIRGQSIHLPQIMGHNRQISSIRSNSNHSKYQTPNQISSFLSKDLSLLNCSLTQQKIMQKVQSSNYLRVSQRLQYERQKLNLLKLFKFYLNKLIDSQQNLNQRVKLQKTVHQLKQKIRTKGERLDEIERLLTQ